MRKIISLFLLIVSSFILYGCSAIDRLSKKEEKFFNVFCESIFQNFEDLSSVKLISIDASYNNGTLIKYTVEGQDKIEGYTTKTNYILTEDYVFSVFDFTKEEKKDLQNIIDLCRQYGIYLNGTTLYKGWNFEEIYIPDTYYFEGTIAGFILKYLIDYKEDKKIDMNERKINKALEEYKQEKGWI